LVRPFTVNETTDEIFIGADVLVAWSMDWRKPLRAERVPCASIS
jgi:hypothetical protein